MFHTRPSRWLALAVFAPLGALATTLTFTNVPPSNAVSVIVKNASGQIVRTLVSNQRSGTTQGGTLQFNWDGTDDFGNPVGNGNYSATVVANSITYTWEGSIGNTSTHTAVGGATDVYRSYEAITQMAADAAGEVFYTLGYTEAGSPFHHFQTSAAQSTTGYGIPDPARKFTSVATDGSLVYYAETGVVSGYSCPAPGGSTFNDANKTFVTARLVSDDSEYAWQGTSYAKLISAGTSGFWTGVDVSTNSCQTQPNNDPRLDTYTGDVVVAPNRLLKSPSGGLAVQRVGRALFVAHADENAIHVLDKLTGQPIATLSVTSPASVCAAIDDSIWVLSSANGGVLLDYQYAAGAWSVVHTINGGFGTALAIGCNPVDGTVDVLNSLSNQVIGMDANGNVLWRLGQLGGYASGGPAISNTRFGFVAGRSYITYLNNGAFWLSDSFNFRSLEFSPSRSYMQQIAYLPATYKVAVHSDDPSRVIAGLLEYAVDYTKPAGTGWTLVRNWGAGQTPSTPTVTAAYLPYLDVDIFAGLEQPYTLSNGRTYAVVWHASPDGLDGDGWKEVVELDAVNGMRPTGLQLPRDTQMYSGGTLRTFIAQPGTFACANPCQIMEQTLAGFDSANNPRWNPAVQIAQASGVIGTFPWQTTIAPIKGDPVRSGEQSFPTLSEAFFPQTSDGQIVSFQSDGVLGYHLGAISRNGNAWNWRVSMDGPFNVDASGNIVDPKDGHYDVGRGVNYTGGIVKAAGTNIFYGYVGEAWNQGEAGQVMHFDSTGAMLGQFGTADYASPANANVLIAGASGNSYGLELAPYSTSTMFVYRSDESQGGGPTRWRVDGLDTVWRQTVNAAQPLSRVFNRK